MEKQILEAEIKLLESLTYTQAYTGSLENLRMKSYVEYSQVLELVNKKRKQLKELK